MSPRRESPPPPVDDDVYELDLEDDSPEEALREAAESVEGSQAQEPATTGADGGAPGGGELQVMREKYLRALADYDNYRKRVERERGETQRAATAEPLRAFLGVVDNLSRAASAGGSADDLKAGVQMILRQTEDLLRRFGVDAVESVGQPFDPAFHEAVVRYEDAGVDQPTVSEEFQKGYRYHGRLLRPAMVKVAVPPEGAHSPREGEERDDDEVS